MIPKDRSNNFCFLRNRTETLQWGLCSMAHQTIFLNWIASEYRFRRLVLCAGLAHFPKHTLAVSHPTEPCSGNCFSLEFLSAHSLPPSAHLNVSLFTVSSLANSTKIWLLFSVFSTLPLLAVLSAPLTSPSVSFIPVRLCCFLDCKLLWVGMLWGSQPFLKEPTMGVAQMMTHFSKINSFL